jgi:LPXTG-site transpeptidase (sortase) family protein
MKLSFIFKYIFVFIAGIGAFMIVNYKYKRVIKEEEIQREVSTYYLDSSKYDSLIEIPLINLKTVIYKGDENMTTIDKGVTYMHGTNMPDEGENTILFGHSGNGDVSYFNNIDNLEEKDLIIIHYNKIKYYYNVTNKYVVDQYDTEIVNKKISNGIMLITCLKGKNKKRLIVEAISDSSIY